MGPLDMMNLMKNAKKMQEMMQEQQKKITQMEVVGEAGAGAVSIRMNGKYQALDVKINPEFLKEAPEVLQDLIAAAINNATSQIAKAQEESVGGLLGGSGMSGLGNLKDLLK